MPFTLSHPAAVLPVRALTKGRLPFAALFAGSLAPDIPYYFTPGKAPYVTAYFMDNAHTFSRSFSYCIPAGVVLLLLARLLAPSFRRILPNGLATLSHGWLAHPLFSPRALPLTLLAILLGAWTHILWDDFTHITGHSVKALPFLRMETVYGFELFRVLQHISTIGGAFLLYRFFQRECALLGQPLVWRKSGKWLAWAGAGAVGLLFTSLTFTHAWNYALTANDRRKGFLFVISLVRNCFVAISLMALLAGAGKARKKQ